jgi:hypothetical protein
MMSRLAAIASMLLLVGCGVVGDFTETQKQAEATAVALEKEFGAKPFVGWNINNGTLTNVNVVFPVATVSTLTVADLESRTRRVVVQEFKQKPKQLMVAVTSAQ